MACSTAEGNQGCNGGLMDYAFEYIIKNGGIDSENDYPYLQSDSLCDFAKTARQSAWVNGFADVPPDNSDQLRLAVAQGPVSVAIEADSDSFQDYSFGVWTRGTRRGRGTGMILCSLLRTCSLNPRFTMTSTAEPISITGYWLLGSKLTARAAGGGWSKTVGLRPGAMTVSGEGRRWKEKKKSPPSPVSLP